MSLCWFYAKHKRGPNRSALFDEKRRWLEECVIEKSATVDVHQSAVEILLLCHHPPFPAEHRRRGENSYEAAQVSPHATTHNLTTSVPSYKHPSTVRVLAPVTNALHSYL